MVLEKPQFPVPNPFILPIVTEKLGIFLILTPPHTLPHPTGQHPLGMFGIPKFSLPSPQLQRCFRLQVESWRCRGRPEQALDTVAQWLLALGTHSRGSQGLGTHSQGSQVLGTHARSLVAEPVALWARIKMDAAKQGMEKLRLW